MMSCMMKINTTKAICCVCGNDAKIFHFKWYCGIKSDPGNYNIKGVCDDKRKKNLKEK